MSETAASDLMHLPEIALARIAVVRGCDEGLVASALAAARLLPETVYGGVIAATFSNPERFPALAVRVASALGLPAATPAFDVQLACSAYPYAIYLAGHLARDTAKPVLVINGDAQTRLVDAADPATGAIFSDAVTATVVTPGRAGMTSPFAFLSQADEALTCSESGPIRMDGFRVFSFVATEVSAFLRPFGTDDFDLFVPHQAQPYMVRQLARTLNLSDKLVTLDECVRNPGSASVAMTLATGGKPNTRALIAGFGAGYSAAAGVVYLTPDFNVFLKKEDTHT